jgi:hypothetical protein
MDQNESTLVREFFVQEIARNRKATRNGLIAGAVLGLILIGYCTALLVMINKIVNPKELAEFVQNQAVLMLPTAKRDLSGALKAAAPEVIKGVVDEVVAVFPQLREFAEGELKKITSEATNTAKAELDAVYGEVVASAKAKVIEWDKAGQPASSQIFLDELKKQIDAQITSRITSKPEESVFAKLDATYQQLVTIEKKLRRLANEKDPNRSEVLEKRLIQSWMLMLEDAVVDVDSNDEGTVQTKPEPAKEEAKAEPAPAAAPAPAPAPAPAQ